MTQSTQNIAKSTEPRKPSKVKQHYRKKRRRATLFAVILIIIVLLVASFMVYSILFKIFHGFLLCINCFIIAQHSWAVVVTLTLCNSSFSIIFSSIIT